MNNAELAVYIFRFLRERNGGELEDAISSMTVASYERALRELEMILEARGRPASWVPDRQPFPVCIVPAGNGPSAVPTFGPVGGGGGGAWPGTPCSIGNGAPGGAAGCGY